MVTSVKQAWFRFGYWTSRLVVTATGARCAGRDLRETPLRRLVFQGACLGVIAGWLVLCGAAPAGAEPGKMKDDAVTVTSKTVTGRLDLVMPKFINVVYDRKGDAEYEMELPYDAKLKVVNKRSLSEMKRGDTVSVKYEEKSWVDEKGMEHKSRKATEVVLLKTAVKGLRTGRAGE